MYPVKRYIGQMEIFIRGRGRRERVAEIAVDKAGFFRLDLDKRREKREPGPWIFVS